jgi:hypothetical protein
MQRPPRGRKSWFVRRKARADSGDAGRYNRERTEKLFPLFGLPLGMSPGGAVRPLEAKQDAHG